MKSAERITRRCIDELVSEFIQYPFSFHSESDMHSFLWARLEKSPLGKKIVTKAHYPTRQFYREFPTREGGRRARYDMAVLESRIISRIDSYDHRLVWRGEWPAPLVAVEMGLNDYKMKHLNDGLEKLLSRENQVGLGIILNFFRDKNLPTGLSRADWIDIMKKESKGHPSLEIRNLELETRQRIEPNCKKRDSFEVNWWNDYTIRSGKVVSKDSSDSS